MAVVCNPIRMGRWSELMVVCVCHSDKVMREADANDTSMIGLLVIICLIMPKKSNIYVLVPILHYLVPYTKILVLI